MRRCAIGVDLGGTNIRAACVEEDGTIILSKQDRTEVGIGKEAVIQEKILGIIKALKEAFDENYGSKKTHKLLGIGMGAPRIINFEKGTYVRGPQFPGWQDVPLRLIVEKAFPGVRVCLENDANSAAWGEKVFGCCKQFHDFIYVTLGTGVGGGVVAGGKLVRGKLGMAGELGHIFVGDHDPYMEQCGCGHFGCVETYASASGLRKRLKRYYDSGRPHIVLKNSLVLDEENVEPKLLFQAFKEGNVLASELFGEMGIKLGAMGAAMVNALNPEAICYYGGITAAWEAFEVPLRTSMRKHAWPEMVDACQILISKLGGNSGVLGAASLLFFDSSTLDSIR